MDFDEFEDGYNQGDEMDGAYELAREVEIYISNDKDLFETIKDNLGNVIGASFVAYDNFDVSFDIVIDADHQGKGHAKNLVETILTFYSDYQPQRFYADCLNPAMSHILEKYFDFVCESQINDRKVMIKQIAS